MFAWRRLCGKKWSVRRQHHHLLHSMRDPSARRRSTCRTRSSAMPSSSASTTHEYSLVSLMYTILSLCCAPENEACTTCDAVSTSNLTHYFWYDVIRDYRMSWTESESTRNKTDYPQVSVRLIRLSCYQRHFHPPLITTHQLSSTIQSSCTNPRYSQHCTYHSSEYIRWTWIAGKIVYAYVCYCFGRRDYGYSI
jgi:hypothetical protein